MDDNPINTSSTMPFSQSHRQNNTLWEYRRMKRRLLSPASRGLIVGAFLLTWVLYSIIIRPEHTMDNDSSIHEFQRPWHKSKHGVSLSKYNQKAATTIGINGVNTDDLPPAARGASDAPEAGLRWGFKQHGLEMLHRNSRTMLQYNEEELEKMKRIREQAMNDKSTEGDSKGSNIEDAEAAGDTTKGQTNSTQPLIDATGDLGLVSRPGFAGGIKGVTNVTEDEEDCVQPAITKFPPTLMGRKVRQYGGVIVHIFVAMYMFVGLAIICDDYFVPALDRISEVLDMPPDVAGATFMAAGSSGPELATAVIGVFVAKDDIGISGVIGSAIFNITLVIAVCALAAEHDFYLSWWSVIRDCTTYLICIAVLLGTIANEIVSWPEALLFLLLYVLYCVAMGFSSRIEAAISDKIPVPRSWREVQTGGVESDVPVDEKGATYKNMQSNIAAAASGGGIVSNGVPGDVEIPLTPDEKQNVNKLMQEDHNTFADPRNKPAPDAGKWAKFKWVTMYPLYTISAWTIPDCRKEAWANSYVATFLIAIVWISIYSYMMVWMIVIIGYTFRIPDTVMGLTFIAAGVSVPDALSGIAVVREGHGDMAVSNAIGSNVFDVLVCLGLPWFIDTAMVNPGSTVKVRSKGLLYSTCSLFSTVIFLIVACHCNNWKLDRKFGVILLVWYFIFMTFAAMYELNVFGPYNAPECTSTI